MRREGHIEDSGRFPGLVADKIIRRRTKGQRKHLLVELRPDEVVRAWGNAKVVGDVWCRKVVHLIVEKNSRAGECFQIMM